MGSGISGLSMKVKGQKQKTSGTNSKTKSNSRSVNPRSDPRLIIPESYPRPINPTNQFYQSCYHSQQQYYQEQNKYIHKPIEKINLDELYVNGYQVLKGYMNIPDKIRNSLMGYRDDEGGPIFNHNEMNGMNDGKRRQYFIKPDPETPWVQKFMDSLDQNLKSIFPYLFPNDWVVIESKPGCKSQAAHADYPPPMGPIELHQIPINVMIPLQKNAALNVWPRSHELVSTEYLSDDPKRYAKYGSMKPINKKIIHLEPGDILLFRGDLVHAGAGYTERNYRMHCYLDYGYREPNKTWLVHRKGSELLRSKILVDV